MKRKFDLVGQIMALEAGELSAEDTLRLFCHLQNEGLIAHLQGSYGHAAAGLIDSGLIFRGNNGRWRPNWDKLAEQLEQ